MPSAEHEAVVESLKQQQGGPAPTSIDEMRAGLDALVGYFRALDFPDGVEQTETLAGGVPGFWFTPKAARADRAILYLHGGGYVMGSVATHRSLIGRIASTSGVRCLALEYRLAPEHPFPAAIEDACAAYRGLLARGIAPSAIAIAGDSAGGGLALGCLVALRDAGDPLPAAAVCLSPLADLELSGDSAARDVDDPLVDRAGTLLMAAAYLQGADPRDPRASPVHADFEGLPPLLIEVGTREILLDDALRVARSARDAGVDVTLERGEGLTHVWQLHPHLPESRESIDRIARFLRKHLG
jgi:monoterpene epsilon-lactone hydrolase